MAGKDLLTEDGVRKLAPGSEIVLGPNKIATPAALDLAFTRGMRVVYADAEAELARGPASDLWKRMKGEDGTYVVQVKNGRATVTRLSDSGPMPFGEE